jgi:hypothetical protein
VEGTSLGDGVGLTPGFSKSHIMHIIIIIIIIITRVSISLHAVKACQPP